MQARAHAALALVAADDPVAGPGEGVVALRTAALNRRDVFLRKGVAPSPLPVIPGSDGAGTVRSVGDGVSGVAGGDEVIVYPALGWGGGEEAPAPGFRILGGPDDGTYAELVRLPAENVLPKPARLSWEEAAALPLAGLTAYRALVSRARIRPGETVLVLGIGGGGATIATMMARAAACRAIVTSSSQEKLDRARDLGADVVVDSVGATWGDSIAAVRPGGRVVAFGGTGGGKVELMVRALTSGQVSLLGTTMAPGFDWDRFELGKRERLLKYWPDQREAIEHHTAA